VNAFRVKAEKPRGEPFVHTHILSARLTLQVQPTPEDPALAVGGDLRRTRHLMILATGHQPGRSQTGPGLTEYPPGSLR